MKKMSGVLLALVFAVWGFAGAAQAAIVNGDFSSGLTGWTVQPSNQNHYVSVISSEENYFAKFHGNTTLSQNISWQEGDTLSFDYWFSGGAGTISSSVGSMNVTGLGSTNNSWTTYSYTPFTKDGTNQTFSFGITGTGGKNYTLLLDNVRITPAAPVPIPGSLLLFGSGLLGLWGIGSRRNKAQLA